MSPTRLVVLDAYAREGRAALAGAGGTEAGTLYRDLLQRLEPSTRVDVVYPADGALAFPAGRSLSDYAGAVWTGSSLTILAGEDVRVRRQVDIARALFEMGVPSFGSCWAVQLATVAAGGTCAANPKGREFGVSRSITLSPEGRDHAMYHGKPPVFDAFTSHADEVMALAPGSALLASNDWSRVQAAQLEHARGKFWAVQYHPEYNLHEVASLCRLRRDELVAQGTFSSVEDAEQTIANMEALNAEPERHDLAARLGVDSSVLDPAIRTREVANWLGRLTPSGNV